MMLNPFEAISKHCVAHKIDPSFLLAALLDALAYGHFHGPQGALFGCAIEGESKPIVPPGVMMEILNLCGTANPPRVANPLTHEGMPSSLLETLEIALSVQQMRNLQHAEHWLKAEAAGTAADSATATLPLSQAYTQLASGQKVLRLIIREAMNDLERRGLESALEEEDEWEEQDDWVEDEAE